MWEWMGDLMRQEKYGIVPGAMEALKAPEGTRAGQTRPVAIPDGADSTHMRWLRDMPDKGTQRRDRLAALLLVYSAQRREYVASAQRADFRVVDDTPVWTIPPAHRNTAEMSECRGVPSGSHVVLLPLAAWEIVQLAMAEAGDSEWLFPGVRPRRAGATVTHLNADNLTHLFREIPGRLATPHDIRRAFATTFADEREIDEEDVKRVLNHSEGSKSGDVTRRHYLFVRAIAKKMPTIEKWCVWADKQADESVTKNLEQIGAQVDSDDDLAPPTRILVMLANLAVSRSSRVIDWTNDWRLRKLAPAEMKRLRLGEGQDAARHGPGGVSPMNWQTSPRGDHGSGTFSAIKAFRPQFCPKVRRALRLKVTNVLDNLLWPSGAE